MPLESKESPLRQHFLYFVIFLNNVEELPVLSTNSSFFAKHTEKQPNYHKMLAKISTVAFQGVQVLPVDVQVQISAGLPTFTIVGLPDKAVAESRERVKASFLSIGLDLPPKKITVNLAPADLQKEGSHYDLPIAMGLMVGLGVLSPEELCNYIILGELGLDGSIARVSGILPTALEANAQGKGIICPESCGQEAAWAGDIPILAASNLLNIINHFKGTQVLAQPVAAFKKKNPKIKTDYKDVKGQLLAKRALEIAAAGGHNVLMIGPPGSGKSMLAARLPGILPALSPKESLEATIIHSLSGQLDESGIIQDRPFRDPHHSASLPALIGGGLKGKPGEISLAHQGVLFLDELPEFARSTLESLRQPIETGRAVIARANAHVTYPARFQLIAAMNPCRCGYFGDLERQCHRAPKCAHEYQSKISGPLMDRFDIVLDVQEVKVSDLLDKNASEESAAILKRVQKARAYRQQLNMMRGLGCDYATNAALTSDLIPEVCQMTPQAEMILSHAIERFKLSGRSYHRILRVARTITDLATEEIIDVSHISEALGYRKIGLH